MKKEVQLSVNQLADFMNASDAKKRSIINQQKTPNEFKISYYQLAKARIKKSMALSGDLDPILNGIEQLKGKKPEKKRQISDRVVSIEALQRFVNLKIPGLLKKYNYQVIKDIKIKSTFFNGVEIVVSPDLIIEIDIEGQKYYGGFKIHISKGNAFDAKQQSYVATAIHKYLSEIFEESGGNVLAELCLSIDVFGDRIVSSPEDITQKVKDIEITCEEVKKIWNAA